MKTFKSILVLAFVIVASISCDSDDDNDTIGSDNGTGSLSYDGNEYALDKGSLINYGGSGNSFNFDITLGSPSLTLDQFGDFDGTGEVVYFELWTDQQSGLKSGTYNFDASSRSDFTFTIADVGIGCNQNGTCTFEDAARTGSVTINKNGDSYDLIFNFTTNTGELITGNYNGSLRSFSDI